MSAIPNGCDRLLEPAGTATPFLWPSCRFGLVQLSPDTQGPARAWYDWYQSGGYCCCDRVITGISHAHIEGTGAPEFGDALLMPQGEAA